MHYPRVVYHKDYATHLPEKERQEKCRVVKSEAQHKEQCPEWGDHPALKKPEVKSPSRVSKKEKVD